MGLFEAAITKMNGYHGFCFFLLIVAACFVYLLRLTNSPAILFSLELLIRFRRLYGGEVPRGPRGRHAQRDARLARGAALPPRARRRTSGQRAVLVCWSLSWSRSRSASQLVPVTGLRSFGLLQHYNDRQLSTSPSPRPQCRPQLCPRVRSTERANRHAPSRLALSREGGRSPAATTASRAAGVECCRRPGRRR